MGATLATPRVSAAAASKPATWRSRILRQVIVWHWVSSGVCLAGMLLFTVTGITLNHASSISAKQEVRRTQTALPAPLLRTLAAGPASGKRALPGGVALWLKDTLGVTAPAEPEWTDVEVYLSLPRPGGDAWATIDRENGVVVYEVTRRGWISYINDLHKGRHTGQAWSLFIDVLAAACLVFTISGFILLQVHAAKRPSTWPLVAFGLLLPVLLIAFFVHQ